LERTHAPMIPGHVVGESRSPHSRRWTLPAPAWTFGSSVSTEAGHSSVWPMR